MIQDTVLIRHLSSSLTHQEKSEFLRHFGAVDVKIVGPESKKTNLIFARFENDRAAEVAVQKLHQLKVLGQKISAEVARGPNIGAVDSTEKRSLSIDEEKQDRILKARETFLRKVGFSIKSYDFNHPPPLNIYYQYPPPTKIVLENISKAMANVPKFYNQVLHLLNKMNLPCPFTDTYPMDSELFMEKSVNAPTFEAEETLLDETPIEDISMSDNESEMGSDVENQGNEIIPVKRKRIPKKVIKRPKFVKPQTFSIQNTGNNKSSLKPNEVFEDLQREHVHKKIELKITADLSSIQEAQEIQAIERSKEGFGLIKAPLKLSEKAAETEETDINPSEESCSTFITSEQLAANRISSKDQRLLPVFKNYQAGAPSCRLYIKNLAKHVQTRDLHFIYKRYYDPELDNVQGSMFDIRLMQEGRMKGQAFITLQSVDQALIALKETNGYILKDKPMVVQFARSAATK